jgi:hypothetical protein
VIDDLAAAGAIGMSRSVFIAGRCRKALRHPWLRFIVLALLLFAFGSRASAHETIDIDKVNETVAANDEAAARVSAAHDPGPKGEAQFALGMVLVEVTDVLNRDLAAHSGRLTVNAELLAKALAQRNAAPRFDDAIGRYRLPRTPLEDALRLSPAAPYAPRARFALLKAGFYESFVLDPFELVGLSFSELERQIAEAEAVPPALLNVDDAEEAAFIHAVDLARAARLAADAEAKRGYTGKAQKALSAFAETYPDSMRAAAAGMILKGIGGTP